MKEWAGFFATQRSEWGKFPAKNLCHVGPDRGTLGEIHAGHAF